MGGLRHLLPRIDILALRLGPPKNWSLSLGDRQHQPPDSRPRRPFHDDASSNLSLQHAAVLQDDRQCPRIVVDCLPRRSLAPDPKCVHPRQPRQHPRCYAPEEASWSWSFVWTRKDIWSRSQGSEAARKGQAMVPGWTDTFDRQARSKGFQQLVRRLQLSPDTKMEFLGV